MNKNSLNFSIKEYRSELSLAILALLTVVAIFIRPLLTITHDFPVNIGTTGLRSDKSHSSNKGASFGQIINDNKFHFKCTIIKSKYRTPYCGLALATSNSWTEGVDLTRYESIIFDIDYTGNAKTARFYLRNYNPEYSNRKNISTTKYHIIEYETSLLNSPFEVKISDFKVADWWVAKNKIPFSLSGNELSNIVIAQLQTGTKVPAGEHTFRINSIKLKKDLISDATFNIILSAFWLAISFGLLAIKITRKNKEISHQKLKTNKLHQEKNRLNKKAQTDALTKVLNRHGIEDYFADLLERNPLNKNPLISAIFFDIDHFKKINDNAGHTVGDSILIELSELVRTHTRMSDKIARWGGEEFVLICEQTRNKDALKLANKLCKIIEKNEFFNNLKITASFGIYTERLIPSTTLTSLTDKADIALYEAKRTGRNNVKNYNDFDE